MGWVWQGTRIPDGGSLVVPGERQRLCPAEATHAGRIFVVDTLGGPYPEYEKIERAVKVSTRPVLVSLRRTPFRDFSADQILGRDQEVGKWRLG